MPLIDVSELTISKIRGFREFAFPPVLANSDSHPFFSINKPEDWLSTLFYELYQTWIDNGSNLGDLVDVENIDDSSVSDLNAFRNFILLAPYPDHDFFSLENAQVWVNPLAYRLWKTSVRPANPFRPPSSMSEYSSYHSHGRSRASSGASDISSIHRYTESEFMHVPSSPISRRSSTASGRVSPAFSHISISSGSDFDVPRMKSPMFVKQESPSLVSIKQESNRSSSSHVKEENSTSDEVQFISPPPKRVRRKKKKGKARARSRSESPQPKEVRLTKKLKVTQLQKIQDIPSTWPVPRDGSGYLLDLSKKGKLPKNTHGNEYSIDGFIRAQDQDSWGGSTGHPSGDVYVHGFNLRGQVPSEGTLCRRAALSCNGIQVCEHFDDDLLAGCERYEPDEDEMKDLWHHELSANEKEASSVTAILARFYKEAKWTKCKKKNCSGKPVMCRLSEGPSKYGKNYFIGCSEWKYTEKYDHRHLPIPANINEDILQEVFASGGVISSRITDNDSCPLMLHPTSSRKSCPYSHVKDGQISEGSIVRRKCATKMIIFIPVDAKIRQVIVVPTEPHNHPMFPKAKPTHEEKKKLEQAIDMAGKTDITVNSLLASRAVNHLYDGNIGESAPAYLNRRKIRDAIRVKKHEDYPRGMDWEGLVYEHAERESKLPIHERYIHVVMNTGDFKLAVTMHPRLAKFIHSVHYLCIDYTFKRVRGNINEWEIVGFVDRFKRRVTFASLYCDSQTTKAFLRLFSEFFQLIPELTGTILKFAAFFPDDVTALLKSIILDAEAAQATALGQFLVHYIAMHGLNIPGLQNPDAITLLKFILKLCVVHFERNIDLLPKDTPVETIRMLKRFVGLKSQEEIEKWHEFCRGLQGKECQNWYKQKLMYPWILPGYNPILSSMKREHWDITPNHTNLGEGAHAARNGETSIGLPILQAILSARERDNAKADEIEQIEKNGVMPKRWNGPAEREHLAAQRHRWATDKKNLRNDNVQVYEDLQSEYAQHSQDAKDSKERQDALTVRLKNLQNEYKMLKTPHVQGEIAKLQKEIRDEQQNRRDLRAQMSEISQSLKQFKEAAGLTGVQMKGRRKSSAPENEAAPAGENSGTVSASAVIDNEPPEGGPPEVGTCGRETDLLEDNDSDMYMPVIVETPSNLVLFAPTSRSESMPTGYDALPDYNTMTWEGDLPSFDFETHHNAQCLDTMAVIPPANLYDPGPSFNSESMTARLAIPPGFSFMQEMEDIAYENQMRLEGYLPIASQPGGFGFSDASGSTSSQVGVVDLFRMPSKRKEAPNDDVAEGSSRRRLYGALG